MRRLLSTLGLVVAACGPAVHPAGLIRPGLAVGPCELGETLDPAAALPAGVSVQRDRGGPVIGITVTDPSFATERGLRVGSTAAEVERLLGEPHEDHLSDVQGKGLRIDALVYDGIAFVLDGDLVAAIQVFED